MMVLNICIRIKKNLCNFFFSYTYVQIPVRIYQNLSPIITFVFSFLEGVRAESFII